MDRHHVLRPGCPLFLGLGLLCPPHCGEFLLTTKVTHPHAIFQNGRNEAEREVAPISISQQPSLNDDDAVGQ